MTYFRNNIQKVWINTNRKIVRDPTTGLQYDHVPDRKVEYSIWSLGARALGGLGGVLEVEDEWMACEIRPWTPRLEKWPLRESSAFL